MALYRKLNRDTKERRSILSGLTKTVLNEGKVKTTEERAKEARKFVDKMITYAKKGDLVSRRKALAFLENDTETVKKLFDQIAPLYAERNGGYTRIVKLNERRGDDALIVLLELV
jgi:large subunit ribosomal protein L17